MARLPYTDVRDLIGAAERFGTALPALAGSLSQPTADATLERMREGVFFLGAMSMDRTADLEAEGQRAIADVVSPELLRPSPAAAIVELSAERSVRRVPAGAQVTTKGPRRCCFGTTNEVRVGPWRVEQTRIDRATDRADVLRFDLVATGSLGLAEAMGSGEPRFFVDGADGALRLLAHVLAHTTRAEVSFEGGLSPARIGPVSAYGARAVDALAPEPDGPHTGLSLVREYFLLPEKFCFFGIGRLTAALRGSGARRATVTLVFREPLPVQATVAPSGVRAHCTAASNLFGTTGEPWVFEAGRTSSPVRVAGLGRDEGGVYAVVGAAATVRDDDAATPVALRPVRRFAAGTSSPGFAYAFSTKLVALVDRAEPEVVLCLTSPRGRPPVLAPHVVSTQLLATNRDHAAGLRPGELSEPGAGMPPGVRARSITPSSAYVPSPGAHELALQAAVRAAVPDGDALFALQSRLLALVPRGGVEAAVVRASIARVAALESLDVVPVLDRVVARRGFEARLGIDETPFRGLGDVALFVRVLHAVFEAQTSIGRFYRCVATCSKSGARIVWPPEAS